LQVRVAKRRMRDEWTLRQLLDYLFFHHWSLC
jgi:hypothetical protein